MKLSIISRFSKSYELEQLQCEAQKANIVCEIHDINVKKNLREQIQSWGDVVLWRSSSLDEMLDKRRIFEAAKKEMKSIINYSVLKNPFIRDKFYQQSVIANMNAIDGIASYEFNQKSDFMDALKNALFNFPLIQKPRIGAEGKDTYLLKKRSDINFSDDTVKNYIFQEFIPNKGDFRVMVLGGRVLGCIKRVAAKGGFLNNVSQGAASSMVADSKILSQLHFIALTVAAAFDITFCGIDIIYDTKEQKYKFLEINTAPQWQGNIFESITGINVSHAIISLCKNIFQRKSEKSSPGFLIENYYFENQKYLARSKLKHFYSRMFLWTGNQKYRQHLMKNKQQFLGKNELDIKKKIDHCLQVSPDQFSINCYELRKPYLQKYPDLQKYDALLFFMLHAKNLYDQNMKKFVIDKVPSEKFIDLYWNLSKDKNAVAILSTYAINFLYLVEYFFTEELKNKRISPQYFFDIAKSFHKNNDPDSICLQLYLLTHCIINESRFYAKKIYKYKNIYQKMIQYTEHIIVNNYFNVSLDCKIEFLVCADLLKYVSFIKNLILDEAKLSFSPHGNFIIDKLNNRRDLYKQNFNAAEHKNVLFLMNEAKYRYNNKKY